MDAVRDTKADLPHFDPSESLPAVDRNSEIKREARELNLCRQIQLVLSSNEFTSALPAGISIHKSEIHRVMGSFVLRSEGNENGEPGTYAVKFGNPLREENTAEMGDCRSRYAKLQWCTEQVSHSPDEILPRIVARGAATINGAKFDWIMQPWVTGIRPPDALLDGPAASALWEAAGRAAANIHSASPEGYGKIFDPNAQRFTQSWDGCVDAMIDKCDIPNLRKCGLYDEASASRMDARLQSLRDLPERYQRCLNHLDFNPGNNILHDPSSLDPGNRPRVSAVIDFDSAASVPGNIFEIANPLVLDLLFDSKNGRHLASFLKGMNIDLAACHGSLRQQDVELAVTCLCATWVPFLNSMARGSERNPPLAPNKEWRDNWDAALVRIEYRFREQGILR